MIDSRGEPLQTNERSRSITSSESALIQAVEPESALIYGVHPSCVNGGNVVRDESIDFGINQEDYETNNGSHYATDEKVEGAQRR